MIFHKKDADLVAFKANDGTLLKELMHPVSDHLSISYSVAHASVDVNAASLPHKLKSSESYYILKGTGMMHIEKKVFEVSEGDIFLVPENAEQYIENTGSVELVFLCIVEPYWRADEDELI